MNGIPVANGERVKDLENRLHQEFSNVGLNIPKEAIDRVHRIGRKLEIEDADEDGHVTGVSVQQHHQSSQDLRTGEIVLKYTEKGRGTSLLNLKLT